MPRCPKTHSEFVEQVKGLSRDEYTVIGVYRGSDTKVRFRHEKCGKEYETRPYNFLSGHRCPSCAKQRNQAGPNSTLCWKCDNAYVSKCGKFDRDDPEKPWHRWTKYKRVKIKEGHRVMISYLVIGCKDFIPDAPRGKRLKPTKSWPVRLREKIYIDDS